MAFGIFGRKLRKVTKQQEREFSEKLKEEHVGFRDGFAMVLAAFLTIILPCLLILCGLGALMLWIFGAFR
ncbi:MAG TPA: hypothetical protein DDW30_07320 [Clostridiales bacterium]|nr:hypothetical protein [Clostridiales bacterium]